MGEKLKLKRYLYMGIIAAMLQMLFYGSGDLSKDYNLYFDLTDIYCGTIAIALAIISVLRKNDSFYKYLGISFLGIGILEYLKVFINIYGVKGQFSEHRNIILSLCIGNLEIIAVIVGIILALKKVSNSMAIFVKLDIVLMIYIIPGVIYLYIFYRLIRKRSVEDRQIKGYMIILSFSAIIKIIFMNEGYVDIVIANTLKMIAYFFVYEGISEKIYNIEINELKDNLRESKNETKKINNKIKTRKTIIDELSKIREREETYHYNIIDTFSEGILIEGETIKYANKVAIELFEIQNLSEFQIKDLAGGILENVKSGERKVVEVNGEAVNIEIHISRIQGEIKIFYVKKIDSILRYEELLRRYESYIRKENVKNEFYTNISHELRTPINIVSTALEVNEIELQKNNLKKVELNNIIIKKNCLRLIRTINNFIDASKISEGYLVLNKKKYNIVEVVEDVVQASVKYIEDYGMEIIFDSSDEEIVANLDRELIERVVLNLLSNSVKYRNREGEKIDVEVIKCEENVYIRVSNNGVRIDRIQEKKIFEKFKKLDNGLNRENEGSGLGLYLCREIIEAHEGEIRLHSNNHTRNEFVIKLKIEKENNKIDINRNINSLEEKVQIEFSDIN